MIKTVYWAVLLDEKSRNMLKAAIPPKHDNVYAEHVTILFAPTDKQDVKMFARWGERVELFVTGVAEDEKGQAVIVHGIERVGGGIPHVTISCADGTKPVYSNNLLQKGYTPVWPFPISGEIAYFTKKGWVAKSERDK